MISGALIASMMGSTPGTCRKVPSSPSSPRNARSSMAAGESCSLATSTPIAMARSRAEPILRTDVGARFTVVRLSGQANPEVSSAARTRSRDSRHEVSGRPTTVNPGRPRATCTSTVTATPATPNRAADGTVASIGPPKHVWWRAIARRDREPTGADPPVSWARWPSLSVHRPRTMASEATDAGLVRSTGELRNHARGDRRRPLWPGPLGAAQPRERQRIRMRGPTPPRKSDTLNSSTAGGGTTRGR
ncbi:unannotated protein [freshwater metagenome]|uniref:Unannotated protein n=1 Tax=freshwater metagenome TaxID=449393 RepID=A0A6J7L1W2_9ZZZZ